MFEYLQKFNVLPKAIKAKVGSPAIVALIGELEKKYNINLAALIMKIAVKEVLFKDLAGYLIKEFNLAEKTAEELAGEIKEKILKEILTYLEENPIRQLNDIITEKTVLVQKNTGTEKEKIVISDQAEGAGKTEFNRPWLAQGGSARNSNFFFSPEDEEEIKELIKKTGISKEQGSVAGRAEEELNKIINKAQINFGSQILAERFKNIIRTYLSGVRDKVEIREALIKPFDLGGLGFDNDSTENVLNIAQEYYKTDKEETGPFPKKFIVSEDKITPPSVRPQDEKNKTAGLKNIGARDLDYDFSNLADKKKRAKEILTKLDTSHELPAKKENIQLAAKNEIKKTETETETEKEENQKLEPAKIIFRPPPSAQGKIRVEDVKFMPKTIGPIDELKFLDLTNFRRLGQTPLLMAKKIKEKIKLLEEDNYASKVEGIRAWRLSPVNRLYLNMGEKSISQNKPINVIIEERKNSGELFLSQEEFEAIMDLNKSLRF